VQLVVEVGPNGARRASALAFWAAHARIEQHLRPSGPPAVLLRPSMYMTILLAAAEAIGRTGRLFAPAGDAATPMVDPPDVAAAAAVVLTEDGRAGNAYTLTGPAAVTHHDAAAQIASTVGRPVDHVDTPGSAARSSSLRIAHGLVAARWAGWKPGRSPQNHPAQPVRATVDPTD
jgi:uncharacterized protein YbjT (DUF2867 family)